MQDVLKIMIEKKPTEWIQSRIERFILRYKASILTEDWYHKLTNKKKKDTDIIQLEEKLKKIRTFAY